MSESLGDWKQRKRAQFGRIQGEIPHARLEIPGDYGTRYAVRLGEGVGFVFGQFERPEDYIPLGHDSLEGDECYYQPGIDLSDEEIDELIVRYRT